jgi:hypothetical protein
LDGNNIGDAGAIALAEVLPSMTALKQLYFGYNPISAAGALALQATALPTLRLIIHI